MRKNVTKCGKVSPGGFSKRTDVIISEQKKDIELTLPTAIIDIFMERQEGSFTTNDDVLVCWSPTSSA